MLGCLGSVLGGWPTQGRFAVNQQRRPGSLSIQRTSPPSDDRIDEEACSVVKRGGPFLFTKENYNGYRQAG